MREPYRYVSVLLCWSYRRDIYPVIEENNKNKNEISHTICTRKRNNMKPLEHTKLIAEISKVPLLHAEVFSTPGVFDPGVFSTPG